MGRGRKEVRIAGRTSNGEGQGGEGHGRSVVAGQTFPRLHLTRELRLGAHGDDYFTAAATTAEGGRRGCRGELPTCLK